MEHRTKKLITEGSEKTIAQFMGEQATGGYYQSWDWLMPVVEKIEDLDDSKHHYQWDDHDGKKRTNFQGYEVDISYNECRIWLNLELDPPKLISFGGRRKTKIESVYQAVVLFIKWRSKRVGGN